MAQKRVGPDDPAYAGQASYTPRFLALYDLLILQVSGRFLWRCPPNQMLRLYDEHVSDAHLDIGVGTGFFLDRCTFPASSPAITLMDLNPNPLEAASKRLRRYGPVTHVGNVLEPIELPHDSFRSVGMNWLLHCVPGTIETKAAVFANVSPLLDDGAVVFGSTVLGEGVDHNALARRVMASYNAKGIFSTAGDHLEGLDRALGEHFSSHSIDTKGSVALFVAHR